MSASRDKNQKVTFLFKKAGSAQTQEVIKEPAFHVLNPSHFPIHEPGIAQVEIRPYCPPELVGKRIDLIRERDRLLGKNSAPTPALPVGVLPQQDAIKSLTGSLRQLMDLHERLKFMLQELEELSKK